MALAAIGVASRHDAAEHRTFGLYRIEILAALANAVLLFGVAGYVLIEAVLRLGDPPEVASGPVLVVGALGLAVNLVAFALLRQGAAESLNVRGAYLEVVADTIGSVGVIVSAAVMWLTGWERVDPIIGAGLGLFILPRAWSLGRASLRILVQAAPAGIDLAEVRSALAALDGVVDVHDLHVWTLTSEMDVLTAHLNVAEGSSTQEVLSRARTMLTGEYGLSHATLQVEIGSSRECDELSW
jgi:cobalt-zinc-cadmium efflux system protein